ELASLSVKIARQDGESFSGTIIGLKGKTERIVGAFRRDGSTFVYSSEKTAGTGRVQGNEMEICRTDAGCPVIIPSKCDAAPSSGSRKPWSAAGRCTPCNAVLAPLS